MSALSFEWIKDFPLWLSPILIFLIGSLGSLHCGFMCGPLCSSFLRNKKDFGIYQLGRLTGYLALATALYISKGLIDIRLDSPHVSIVGILFFSSLLIWSLGHFSFFHRVYVRIKASFKSFSPLKWSFNFFNKLRVLNNFSLGFLNAFIPCGWLWLFLTSSLLAENYFLLLLWTLCFWASGLGVLYLVVFKAKQIRFPHKDKLVKVLAIAFIIFSVVNLSHYVEHMLFPPTKEVKGFLCH